MVSVWRGLVGSAVLSLTLACAHQTYPPALPAPRLQWDNSTAFIPNTPPPPELRAIALPPTPPPGIPTEQEWNLWKPQPQRICTGKGKRQRCRVESAETGVTNQTTVRATGANTGNGQSAQVRFRYQEGKIYEVMTSQAYPTYLFLPPGERLAAPIALNTDEKTPRAWAYGLAEQRKGEPDRQEVVAIRPLSDPADGQFRPFDTITGLLFRSGVTIFCKLIAREAPGMISVTWELPAPTTPVPAEVPVMQRPPKVDLSRIFSNYRIEPQGKTRPPWVPVSAFDDGTRTFIKFAEPLTYTRGPGVFGVTPAGTTALVQSRMYTVPQRPELGAWMIVQGLWPALELKDNAGLTVKIVRGELEAAVYKEVKDAPSRKSAARGDMLPALELTSSR
jgi:type IV secretion system protein TrbG